jgi:uncharacterized protein YvpB
MYKTPPKSNSSATKVVLPVPHLNQRNNVGNEVVYGDQMCNVTSLAMCASYYGATPDVPFTQLEDQISDHLINNGLSHYEPYNLEKGYNTLFTRSVDEFVPDASLDWIISCIRQARPCVVHGYFTKSGHIVVVRGFDLDTQMVCINDPYGEWHGYGYEKHDTVNEQDQEGKEVWMTFDTFNKLCNDGGIWTHVISPVL